MKVKTAAVKEHGGFVVFHVAEDSAVYAHDLAVDPVCHGICDFVRSIADPGSLAAP
jgi:hypothetical protein